MWDIRICKNLSSEEYGSVHEAWWLNPPVSVSAVAGPVEYVSNPSLPPVNGAAASCDVDSDGVGRSSVPAVKVAVKYVQVVEEDGVAHSKRALNSLHREMQVRYMRGTGAHSGFGYALVAVEFHRLLCPLLPCRS
jgi:hypothetical protein